MILGYKWYYVGTDITDKSQIYTNGQITGYILYSNSYLSTSLKCNHDAIANKCINQIIGLPILSQCYRSFIIDKMAYDIIIVFYYYSWN